MEEGVGCSIMVEYKCQLNQDYVQVSFIQKATKLMVCLRATIKKIESQSVVKRVPVGNVEFFVFVFVCVL